MAITEIRENELIYRSQDPSNSQHAAEAVFIYTTFCGTCQLAERMLNIVQATGVRIPIYKLNINYAPQLREAWKVTSVPCLALLSNGAPIRLEYSMQSVDYLYNLINTYTPTTHN